MKIIKTLSIITFTLLLFSCPTDDNNRTDYLKVINSTENDIYIYYRGEPILYNEPPTINQLISANSHEVYGETYRNSLSDGSFTYIWLLDRATVDENPWESIIDNDMYLIRYDLTLDDLVNMNWVIEFTGL